MGLDMYLYASKYVSGWDHTKDKNFDKIVKLMGLESGDVEKSIDVYLMVGYWRKANAIHNWFVKNVQNGTDDCQKYVLDKEQLNELQDLCKKALEAYENKDFTEASRLLPPAAGFFFGSTEIDEYWAQDIAQTIKIVEKLKGKKFEGFDFYYQSSW